MSISDEQSHFPGLNQPLVDDDNNDLSPLYQDEIKSTPTRILDREGLFHQCRGRWHVRNPISTALPNKSPSETASIDFAKRIIPSRARTCWDDWFHFLAYTPTLFLFGYLFLWYTLTICFWAGVYLIAAKYGVTDITKQSSNIEGNGIEPYCGMDITNHMEALYFSLSTMTTIGYGVSDYYFGGCLAPFILVLAQVFSAIAFDAIAIGLLFQRLSRGQKRGRTIVFSDKACVRRVRGELMFLFRVGEFRRQSIIEARIRLYCVRHERYPIQNSHAFDENGAHNFRGEEELGLAKKNSLGKSNVLENSRNTKKDNSSLFAESSNHSDTSIPIETSHYVTRSARLLNPDEDHGGYLLMNLPQIVVHKMDVRSPLMPPTPKWYDFKGTKHGTIDMDDRFGSKARRNCSQKKNILHFFEDRDLEVIVLLEGTDEITGSSIQSRHSYKSDDIFFDHSFAECIFPNPARESSNQRQNVLCDNEKDQLGIQDKGTSHVRKRRNSQLDLAIQSKGRRSKACHCVIDFRKFHDIIPVPEDCEWCPFIPNYS